MAMNPVTREPDLVERCTEVLGLPCADLNLYFKAYLQRTLAGLDFNDYLTMATARSNRSFLFENSRLAFDMMREPGVPAVMHDRFIQLAPLLFPLAPKVCPERVFEILCSVPASNDVFHEKHITLSSFQTYIDALKVEFDEHRKLESHQSLIDAISPSSLFCSVSDTDAQSHYEGLVLRDRIVFVSNTATLKQTLGNAAGTFIVTDSAVAFQTSGQLQILRRTILYPLNHLVQISPSQRGVFKTGYTLVLEFDVDVTPSGSDGDVVDINMDGTEPARDSLPESRTGSRRSSLGDVSSAPRSILEVAFSSEHERDFCLEYLQSLVCAIEMCRQTSIPIVRQVVLHDAIDDVLRCQALRITRSPCHDRTIALFATMLPTETDDYLGMLTCQFQDMTSSCSLISSLFSRSPSRILEDPEWDPRMLELVDNPIPNAPTRNKLDLGQLSDAAKSFAALISPLDLLSQLHLYLFTWQNPSATLSFVAAILLLAYMNWLVYIPAVLVLCNYILMWLLADRPDVISSIFVALSDKPQSTPIQHEKKILAEKVIGASLINKIKSKVDDYQQSFVSAKSALETVQNKLNVANYYIMKLKGLYTWVSPLRSRQYMALNALLFAMLAILPFRFLFSLLVIVHFTEHFRNESGIVQKFISTIPLSDPPRLRK